MAPRLKLPENFKVRCFGSSRNSNGVGKYLVTNRSTPFGGFTGVPMEIDQCDITHVSETRLSQSLFREGDRDPPSEDTVVFPGVTDALDTPSDGEHCVTGKRKRRKAPADARKRSRTSPATITRRWQEVWACKFAWVEGEFDSNGDLTGVICQSCTTMTGRKKVMVPKLDNLEKHEGKRTCREDGVPHSHLKKGETFVKADCKHVKFCKLWASRKQGCSVAEQLTGGVEGEFKRKGVQFSTLFQVLTHGRPMCDYEREQYLLRHLKVRNLPRKHWSESTGWEMSEHLHSSVLTALKSIVQSVRIISISADEVTTVDNTCWIGVHVYAMDSWERVPHLLHLSCVSEGGTADQLTNVIMHALLDEGGLSHEEIASKLVCFGADGVSTFQGPKTSVTTQIRDKWAPFTLGANCVSHRINLVVETLSKYPMVSRLEGLFQSVYSYFCRSNKRHTELQKLANLMETKGNKMLRNVETRWISMRSPAQRILAEYRTLLVKMGVDMTGGPGQKSVAGAADNFDLLSDIEVLLSLACFVPLVNAVHCLIKLSQARDIFIYDFMQAIKVCQNELARLFIDGATAFSKEDFPQYCELVTLQSSEVPLQWKELPGDSGISHLFYNLSVTHVYARCHDNQTGEHIYVTQQDFHRVQDTIERQFADIAQSLSAELDRRFPEQELLDAFGIIYPQYWRQEGANESFAKHLLVLKSFYSHARLVNKGQPLYEGGKPHTAPEMLSASNLDLQQGLFKVTMQANCEAACGEPLDVNPVIKLWRRLSQPRHLCKLISEYFKVGEIGCCLVLGSVEDERCFSTLKFLKSCQRNRLGKHLPLVVRMFGQKYFSLQNFPYKEAINSWKSAVKVGRQGDI